MDLRILVVNVVLQKIVKVEIVISVIEIHLCNVIVVVLIIQVELVVSVEVKILGTLLVKVHYVIFYEQDDS